MHNLYIVSVVCGRRFSRLGFSFVVLKRSNHRNLLHNFFLSYFEIGLLIIVFLYWFTFTCLIVAVFWFMQIVFLQSPDIWQK